MDTNDFIIERVTTFSPEIADAVRNLIRQIGNNYQELTDTEFQSIVDSPQSFLLLARDNATQQIAGMIMVIIYRIPYAKKAYIDDLIIDESFRKRGIATVLMQKAVSLAKEQHAKYIDLTASSSRAAGNNLYQKLGFEKRETNVYRMLINYEQI